MIRRLSASSDHKNEPRRDVVFRRGILAQYEQTVSVSGTSHNNNSALGSKATGGVLEVHKMAFGVV